MSTIKNAPVGFIELSTVATGNTVMINIDHISSFSKYNDEVQIRLIDEVYYNVKESMDDIRAQIEYDRNVKQKRK